MSWGVRPDKRFRLAVGSFIEEYRYTHARTHAHTHTHTHTHTTYLYNVLTLACNNIILD